MKLVNKWRVEKWKTVSLSLRWTILLIYSSIWSLNYSMDVSPTATNLTPATFYIFYSLLKLFHHVYFNAEFKFLNILIAI